MESDFIVDNRYDKQNAAFRGALDQRGVNCGGNLRTRPHHDRTGRKRQPVALRAGVGVVAAALIA